MQNEVHQLCRHLIEKKFGQGRSEFWTDSNFSALREEIHKETRILISKNTLKRYFGKLDTHQQYDPQRETKNALVRYIGFSDWYAFEVDHFPDKALPELETGEQKDTKSDEQSRPPGKNQVLVATLFLGIAGLLAWWATRESANPPPPWTFRMENATDTAPFTLKSHFRVPESKDSFFLSNGDPKGEWLHPGDSLLTEMISSPTYFWKVVKYGNVRLKLYPVYGLSRDWELYMRSEGTKVDIRVENPMNQSGSGLGLSRSFFIGKNLDSTHFIQEMYQFREFGVDCDNFTAELETTLDKPLASCRFMTVRFFGSEKHLEYRVGPGFCAHSHFINLSEQFFTGKGYDFSASHHPYGKRIITRMEVQDKLARLYIGEKKVYEGRYQLPVGLLKGVRISMDGFGTLHRIRIWDKKGEAKENRLF